MIPGTGPGRGTPWWRRGRVWILRPVFGAEVSWAPVAFGSPEPEGVQREGRTVAVIGRS